MTFKHFQLKYPQYDILLTIQEDNIVSECPTKLSLTSELKK